MKAPTPSVVILREVAGFIQHDKINNCHNSLRFQHCKHMHDLLLKMKVKFLAGILLLCCITSCTLYTKPKIEPIPIPKEYKNTIKTKNCDLKTTWWENFHDAKLNDLVNKALKNNLQYQIAIKNIAIANTFVDENFSNYFPQVNLNYSSQRELLSQNAFTTAQNTLTNNRGSSASRRFSLHELNTSVSYQLDFWNQIGNSVNQAKADTSAAQAASDIVKLTLTSDVTATYFQLQTLNETLQNLRDQYQTLNEITKQTDNQYKSGLVNIEPIDNAKIQADSVKNNLLNFTKNQEVLKNTLAYLLGVFPEKFSYEIKSNLKTRDFTQLIPEGIPAQTVVLRPDIQQAFYQILSYGYLEKQNIANFLPSFSLTGMYGFASNNFSKFLSNSSSTWNYGINALLPVFNYKQLSSQYKRSKIQFDAAVLNYKNVVINSYTEVDNALSSYKLDYSAFKTYQRTLNYSAEKYQSAKAQYGAGLLNYAGYLNYKLVYLQDQYNLINQRLLVYEDIIQIYKALGLGLN